MQLANTGAVDHHLSSFLFLTVAVLKIDGLLMPSLRCCLRFPSASAASLILLCTCWLAELFHTAAFAVIRSAVLCVVCEMHFISLFQSIASCLLLYFIVFLFLSAFIVLLSSFGWGKSRCVELPVPMLTHYVALGLQSKQYKTLLVPSLYSAQSVLALLSRSSAMLPLRQ